MSYLEGGCPFCYRAFSEYVESESFAGKWVTIDVPEDIIIGEASGAKEWLYKCLKHYNEKNGVVRFNLDSLR
jgi:hypothetical protein